MIYPQITQISQIRKEDFLLLLSHHWVAHYD